MRLYIYLNKDIIRSIAPMMSDVSFNIDFFEYSEKTGYSTNTNTSIRPEIEKNSRLECNDKIENFNKNKIYASGERGTLCNFQIERRYINIEDVSSIKNNSFYYNILEKLPMDDRIKRNTGKIKELTETYFYIDNNKYLIDKSIYINIKELYENSCDIVVIGYKINCLNQDFDVFRLITIYIE